MLSRRHLAGLVMALGFSGAGMAVLAVLSKEGRQLASYRQWEYVGLAVLILLALWVTDGLRTQALLRLAGNKIGLGKVISINLATNFVASITPMGAGGPPAQTYFLFTQGVKLDQSLAVAISRLLLTILFFLIAIPLIVFFYWRALAWDSMLGISIVICFALIIVGLSFLIFFITHPAKVRSMVSGFLSWPPFRLLKLDKDRIADQAYEEVIGLNSSLRFLMVGSPAITLMVLIYTLLYWLFFFSLAPVLLMGLGLNVPVMLTIVRQALIYFVVSYIPVPGGSGVAEIGLASLFASLVPKIFLAAFVGGWRVLTFYSNLIFGGIAFARLSNHHHRFDAPLSRGF